VSKKNKITTPKNILKNIQSFEDIDSEIKKLSIQKSLLLQDHLSSTDVDKIVKASNYISKIEKNDNKTGNLKTFLFSPDHEFTNGLNYKVTTKQVTFDMLRKVGKTPTINSVISTRIEQIKNFTKFTTDTQKEGWTIKRKVSAFEEKDYKITDKDKVEIQKIVKFIEEGGENNKWDINDDFEEFVSKFMWDSLTLDQACALPGHFVELSDGVPCKIEEINQGMKVRTHTGEIKEVIKTTNRLYTGDLIDIKIKGQNLIVTEGHPVLVAKKISKLGYTVELSKPEWIAAGDLTTNNYVVYPKFKPKNNKEIWLPIFNEEPRKYPVGDFDRLVKEVGFHKKNVYNLLAFESENPILTKHFSKKNIDRVKELAKEIGVSYQYKQKYEPLTLLDKDWFYFIGLYLAEGSINDNTVNLTFHENEIEMLNFVEYFAKKNKIGVNIIKDKRNKGVGIFLSSKALCCFLKKHCGNGSGNKFISDIFLNADKKFRLQLIRGYLDGDGYIKENKTVVVTTSKHLFYGLRMLFSTENIYLSESITEFKNKNWKNSHRGQLGGVYYRELAKEIGYPVKDFEFNNICIKNDKDYLYIKINELKSKYVENTFVYNLEVEGDHSYIMEGFINHNCTEFERNRGFKLVSYQAVDSAMMRFIETIDPSEREKTQYEEIFGYLPIYCQTHNNVVLRNKEGEEIIYYPWELCLGIRNKSTDIRQNGYGTSELEILLEVITWLLWGMQYNGNFFKQGSNFPGFFSLAGEGGEIDQTMLNEFRSYWRDTLVGVSNSHKVPFFNQDVKWTPTGQTNKDMEHARWIELLTVLTCSVYHIDPSELGFSLEFQKNTFGQQGQKERLDHSKNKGLKPLLVFLAKHINKYLVSELNPQYQFVWTGIDIEDETQLLDNDIKKLTNGFMSLEDGFQKYNDRPFNPEKDTILNSVYQQAKAASQYGGQESNQAVDQMNVEQSKNPFEKQDQVQKGNPIDNEVNNYILKAFRNG
jgi:intein/homing endonuclease